MQGTLRLKSTNMSTIPDGVTEAQMLEKSALTIKLCPIWLIINVIVSKQNQVVNAYLMPKFMKPASSVNGLLLGLTSFRALLLRVDILADRFLAGHHLAFALINLRHLMTSKV
jgi:hypothetical protein